MRASNCTAPDVNLVGGTLLVPFGSKYPQSRRDLCIWDPKKVFFAYFKA